jgi:hypothetical protein
MFSAVAETLGEVCSRGRDLCWRQLGLKPRKPFLLLVFWSFRILFEQTSFNSTDKSTPVVLFSLRTCIVTVAYLQLPCSWSLCTSTSLRTWLVVMLWSVVICPGPSLTRRKATVLEILEYIIFYINAWRYPTIVFCVLAWHYLAIIFYIIAWRYPTVLFYIVASHYLVIIFYIIAWRYLTDTVLHCCLTLQYCNVLHYGLIVPYSGVLHYGLTLPYSSVLYYITLRYRYQCSEIEFLTW